MTTHDGGVTGGQRADVVHSILANDERRTVVRTLATRDAPMDISTLVDRVAGHRAGHDDSRSIRIRLYHQHLPKMCDAGVVEYDREVDEVTLTPMGWRVDAVAKRTAELFEDGPPHAM